MTSPFTFAGIRRAAIVVATSTAVATACSGADVPRGIDPVASASVVVSAPGRVARQGCEPGSPMAAFGDGLEFEGRVDGRGELWALFLADPIRSGDPTDVHWRIDGDKTMHVVLVGPEGQVIPASAPQPDPSQDWDRPGEPWSGTITFPTAGCWRVYVERARVRGDVWLEVA